MFFLLYERMAAILTKIKVFTMQTKIFMPLLMLAYCFFPVLEAKVVNKCQTDVNVYGGYAAIKSEDSVLIPPNSRVVSRLNWTANNVWIMGASGKIFFPSNQAYMKLDGWSKVYASDGKFVDRDYLNDLNPSERTDISIHSHTKLKTAFAIDFELGKNFETNPQKKSPWAFGYLVGVKYMQMNWESRGGKYNYSSGAVQGTFPSNLKVIRYSEQLTIPYLGAQAIWQCSPTWRFSCFGKYSGLGYIECRDDHLLWPKYFTSIHRLANYWVIGFEGVWRYSNKLSANIKYSYDHLNQAIGDTTVRSSSGTFKLPNTSGVKFSLQTVVIGALYKF